MKVWIKKIFITLATIMMVALCGLFAACGEPEAIDQTTIKYDGKTITWQAVDAEKYEVSINGGTAYTAPTAAFNYPVDSSVEMVEITITAYNGDKASESVTKLFTRLPKIEVSTITFDENGKMSWPAVAGATEYALKINGQEKRTPATEYEDFVAGQTNTIQIMPVAVGDSSFSEWSTQLNKEYLAPPSAIKYDGQDITWSGTSVASGYQIYINGAKYGNPVTNASFLAYDAANESFDLQIQAIGNGTTSFHSKLSDKKRYVFLADIPLDSINVNDDGILTWSEVEEASGYMVKLNNNAAQFVETNSFENIPAGVDNRISIKPVTEENEGATTYYSNWSQEKTFHILVAPTIKWQENMVLDGQKMNFLFWTRPSGEVGGYNVKVVMPDGTERIDPLGAEAIQYGNEAFEKAGDYQISVQTLKKAGSNSFNSQWCHPITVTRLPSPNQVQNWIVSDASNVKNGFTLNWQGVSGATKYEIYKEQEMILTSTTSTIQVPYTAFASADDTAQKIINFSIKAIGSIKDFNTDKKVTLDSLTSQNLKLTVTMLAQPKDLKIEGYTASWTTDTSASGYTVTIGDQGYSSTGTYDLENLESGRYDFGVCAKGNGAEILASNYTATKTLVRLAAPTNVRIDASNASGDQITWDHIGSNVDHYDLYWANATEVPMNAEKMTDIIKEIGTDGRGLFVRAAANEWDDNETVYYITSKPSQTVMFTRLQNPSFNNVKVNDAGCLVWNPSSNVAGTTIRYRVYNADTGYVMGTTDAHELYLPDLRGGNTYRFYVQAVGAAISGVKDAYFVSSDVSDKTKIEIAQFTKLYTPEIKAFTEGDTAYKWDDVGGDVKNYIVTVNGEIKETIAYVSASAEYSFAPKFQTTGEYQVVIYAQGDGEATINSDRWEKKQLVKEASKPGISLSYCDKATGTVLTQHADNGELVVTVTGPSDHTAGYRVTINVETTRYIKTGETVCKEPVNVAGDYTVRVYANGGVFGANGNYYVESSNADPATSKLTILAAPTNVRPENGGLGICDASGQGVTFNWIVKFIDSTGKEDVEEFTTTQSSFYYKDHIEKNKDGQYQVLEMTVYLSSGGSTVISSKPATWSLYS